MPKNEPGSKREPKCNCNYKRQQDVNTDTRARQHVNTRLRGLAIAEIARYTQLIGARMNLEVVEALTLAGEGASSQHWSRNATRPRYSLNHEEVKEASFTHRFTCFDVAERVEADHEVLFAGRVSRLLLSVIHM